MPSKVTHAILDAADALAEFANLEPANVSDFRARHSNFAPPGVWEGHTANDAPRLWKIEQARVRDAWQKNFPHEGSVLMISEIAKLSQLDQRMDQLQKMSLEEYEGAVADAKKNGANWLPKPESWPYQEAVMFLTMEPWRARICGECGNRFVADHAKRKYCSVAGADGSKCSAKVIDRTHLEWGRANNWGRAKAKRTRKKA